MGEHGIRKIVLDIPASVVHVQYLLAQNLTHAVDYSDAKSACMNTLRPRQNGRHFPDDIFKWIFLDDNVWISINISLKFVPRGPINNIPALVQIMAWRRWGDKILSEPMMVRLPTHICVTRPQWVDSNFPCTYHLICSDFITELQWEYCVQITVGNHHYYAFCECVTDV